MVWERLLCCGLLVLASADQDAPVISLDLATAGWGGDDSDVTVCRTHEQWDVLLHGGTPSQPSC